MAHIQLNCVNDCLNELAEMLDVDAPCANVPLGCLAFRSADSEAMYTLAVRVSPEVITKCVCRQKNKHKSDLIFFGKHLKVRRWDDLTKPGCGCPKYFYAWEPSLSTCIYNAYHIWNRIRIESQEEIEDEEDEIMGCVVRAENNHGQKEQDKASGLKQ
ncbi:hypothetical protein V5O48_013867 [Marasmius crinis-equi]|uniref:Uncharacterized protein n=1 Tax=Marasmius crinis-equi TaxID=585013 RepID=A0ABR3EZ98_9AGAR